MSMLNRVMLRRSATLYGYENQASDLVRRLPFCEPKFPDQRAGIKAQRGSDATVTPRTRSRRRAARTYATQASTMSARRLDCSSPQLRIPTTAAIPPIQIRIENAPMTPAMHPQKNEAARATRTPMRARSNHSGIAKILSPSLSWDK